MKEGMGMVEKVIMRLCKRNWCTITFLRAPRHWSAYGLASSSPLNCPSTSITRFSLSPSLISPSPRARYTLSVLHPFLYLLGPSPSPTQTHFIKKEWMTVPTSLHPSLTYNRTNIEISASVSLRKANIIAHKIALSRDRHFSPKIFIV